MSSGQEVGEIFGEGTGPATALLRSPAVIIASVALWGMNVFLFRLFGIDYVRVLLHDVKKEEQEKKLKAESEEKREIDGTMDYSPSKKKRIQGGVVHTELQTSDLQLTEESSISARSISSAGNSSNKMQEVEMAPLSNPPSTNSSIADDDDTFVAVSLASDGEMKPAFNPHLEVTETKLIGLAGVLIFTLYLTSMFWIQVAKGSTIGAIFMFYLLVVIGIMIPVPSTAWVRLSVKTVLFRAKELLNPRCSCITRRPRPVPFIDVFFADAMCSMSKVFFDWGMLWTLAAHYPNPVPQSYQTIIIPSCFASLPYIIRARQCLIMYSVGKRKKDPSRYHHVLNAIKYSTSLFPLIVSAYQKTLDNEEVGKKFEVILIVLLAINATYCLTWDITMDWGMMKNPSAIVEHTMGHCLPVPSSVTKKQTGCLEATLRPRLRFGGSMSLIILVIDIILRFSWTLRFYESQIFTSNDAYILCTEFLEVFRRALWNLLRVEWEYIKQMKAKKAQVAGEDSLEMTGLK